jgi:hypothetical protein
MAKGSEKSKVKKLKNLNNQLMSFKDNPAKAARIQNRILTVESQK